MPEPELRAWRAWPFPTPFPMPAADPRAPFMEEPTGAREGSAGPTGAAGWESRTGPATVPPFGSASRHSPKPAPSHDPVPATCCVPVPPWHQGHSRVLVSLPPRGSDTCMGGRELYPRVPALGMGSRKMLLTPRFTPNHGTVGRMGRPGAGHQCQRVPGHFLLLGTSWCL